MRKQSGPRTINVMIRREIKRSGTVTPSTLMAYPTIISSAPPATAAVAEDETDPVYAASESALLAAGDAAKLAAINQGLATTDAVTFADITIISGATFGSEINNGNSGAGTKNLDLSAGNKQKITATGSATFTFTAPTGPCNIIIRVIGNGTGYTLTWPSMHWIGTALTTTTGTGGQWYVVALYFDGTTYTAQASPETVTA